MPLESINLECWRFRGSVDGMPPWLAHPAHVVSEGLATEMLAGGRGGVHGEPVLRLADGQVMGRGDVAIRPVTGDVPTIMHAADFRQRFGVAA